MDINTTLMNELQLKEWQVKNTIDLIDSGNTIPFIARYRKEATGSLDDQLLRRFSDRLSYLRNLDENRQRIKEAIEAQGKMTEDIAEAINAAATLTELEDIYRPYKQKRKTRASAAKEKGLEPLSQLIYAQNKTTDPNYLAEEFLNEQVETIEDALQGASDIIAELISDDAEIRKLIREFLFKTGEIAAELADNQNEGVYKIYSEYSEPVSKIPPHRILAINRGEKEGFLKVSLKSDASKAIEIIARKHIKNNSVCGNFVMSAAEDSYHRLIFPSVEREVRNELTDTASESAIKVFSVNLRQLLMQPPVRGKTALGLDPGYRTGCKAAVVDPTGKVLETAVIYPAPPHKKIEQAKAIVSELIKKHQIEIIAIGNGTASHETEVFVSELIEETSAPVSYMVVSEAGASVYSASKLAAEEFPEYDVSLRSAVSIARRLQDPLAELVKIDPKSVGVGQYQHDMPQNRLEQALDGIVEDCVNSVGADLNTASAPLLNRVSGINTAVAKNIVAFREENGMFTSRSQLKKVPKLGPKAFTQCAGFLKVPESKEFLDNTAVHPESYAAAKQLIKMYRDANNDNSDLVKIKDYIDKNGAGNVAEKLGIGEPTLIDIVNELTKPGRDPRDELPPPMLRKEILDLGHLKAGMELKGTVRNVVDFGAFIDIGVHQDGLVHISEISKSYIKHPSQFLKVGDIVTVWVKSVDADKKRISLTMINPVA